MSSAFLYLSLLISDYGIFLTPPDVQIEDLQRFPPPVMVDYWVDFALEHKAWLFNKWHNNSWPEDFEYWAERYQDEFYRWDVWDDLQRAQRAEDEYTKKFYLRCIRTKLGYEAYWYGVMPLPCWIEEFWNKN